MEWEGRSVYSVSGRVLAGVLLCIFGTLVATSSAAANPGLYPDFGSRNELLFYLAVMNLPIDLFCFSVLVSFMCREYGARVGRIPHKSSLFLVVVVLASFVIALSGAIIDFYSFYGRDLQGYSLWWGDRGPLYESLNLYLALVSIFLSVFLTSVILVRTRWMVGLYAAAGMTAINFVAWIIILGLSDSMARDFAVLLSTAFWFLAIIPLYLLWKWHRNVDLKDATTPEQEQIQHLGTTERNKS